MALGDRIEGLLIGLSGARLSTEGLTTGLSAGLSGAGGDSMVMVSVSETYDIQTKVNKMTLIGIHTPKKEIIQKMYPGLAMNCKYWRIDHVDVDIAAVSTLPLSPDQVGFDTGDIAPQDMLNPILYKACSNDSWSTIDARIHGLIRQIQGGSWSALPMQGSMAVAEDDGVTGITDEHGVYYSLLSNRDGFRVAGVQQGLSIHGLVPLVFEKLYTTGENKTWTNDGSANDQPQVIAETSEGALTLTTPYIMSVRGSAHPMPRLNTTYLTYIDGMTPNYGTNIQSNGMADGNPPNAQMQMPDCPPVMLGCIIMPPMTNTPMWFRMVCRAYIEFTDVRPITEITNFASMSGLASTVYHSNYATLSRNMEEKTDMVDGRGVESITKVMEGA